MKTLLALQIFAVAVGMQRSLAAPETSVKGFATVEVRQLSKRSLEKGDSYQVLVNALGEEHNLNLEAPASSVFTPDFQYMEISAANENGELRFEDATPSREELRAIEKNFYKDSQSKATVSLRQAPDGQSYKLNGLLNDFVAIRANDELEVHEVVRKSDSESGKEANDYVDMQRKLTPGKQSRSTSYASPEVLVIFDYANTQTLGSREEILDYMGVFFHAINNRYDTAEDPQISFKLSGVTSITSLSAQPYMENNRVPGGYDINKVLEDLSRWSFQNSRNTPRYDLIALITGTDMMTKDSKGRWESAVAGLAYLKAACWNATRSGRYLGASVTEDIGGFYNGMFSVAHELAHNMGAPHDGQSDQGTGDCPWSQGYIMSYEGWGTKNKFYFSPCSLQLMKELIDSKEGTCTRTQQASSNIPLSSDNIGDRFTMTELCIKYTNSTEAVPDPDTSADSLCKNLKCRYPLPNRPGWYSIKTVNHPPGDDTPCGDNKRCVDGDCV